MSYEEKVAWVSGLVAALVVGVYTSFVVPQMSAGPVGAIAYQVPMLIAIGAMVIVSIVGMIAMSIASAISAQVAGTGSVEDIGRTDERDEHINRRGELIGYYVSSVGLVGALALAMLEADHFWISHAIFVSLLIGTVISSAAKIFIYRRGF